MIRCDIWGAKGTCDSAAKSNPSAHHSHANVAPHEEIAKPLSSLVTQYNYLTFREITPKKSNTKGVE